MREEIIEYIKSTYNVTPENLWLKWPNYMVFRNNANKKWFGIIMDVERKTLNLQGEGKIDIMCVKCNPSDLFFLLNEKGFLPAYHLNKKNWVTIMLDGQADINKVFYMLDLSYKIVDIKNKKSKM